MLTEDPARPEPYPVEGRAGTPTTVLVAVQSPQVREGLVAMLGALDAFEVVAEACSDEQAIELARQMRPQLALIDQELSGHGGWWTINALQREQLADVIVALGRRGEGLFAQLAGAQAYVQMGCAPRELLSAVRDALRVA
ncbi:MAG TPA: response regulator [Chloroflexota bacterium]|nr:response regulator [Chloroflexota bacterium]